MLAIVQLVMPLKSYTVVNSIKSKRSSDILAWYFQKFFVFIFLQKFATDKY